jgi:hypothetical protein
MPHKLSSPEARSESCSEAMARSPWSESPASSAACSESCEEAAPAAEQGKRGARLAAMQVTRVSLSLNDSCRPAKDERQRSARHRQA